MKILHLRFLNLNSLAGEWSIDFTHPDYSGGGLFTITGPTGVGKTTILDAVCLALYGQTPRLRGISAGANEIMTRGTGECLAEVRFESPAGRFRCHWSQHRSRKKAEGNLQAARHEIVDDQSGKVIESYLSKVEAVVTDVTGMNFDQFTRSMMLAQGAFAAFLEAPPKERAELLEQITGVGIYTDISMKAYQRAKTEKTRYGELEKFYIESGPGDVDEKELTAEKKRLDKEAKTVERQWREKTDLKNAFELLAALEKETETLAVRATELETLEKSQRPASAALALALSAQNFEPDYSALTAAQKNREQAEKNLAEIIGQAPVLAAKVKEAQKAATQKETELREVKERAEKLRPILIEARRLDAQVAEKNSRLNPLEEQLNESRRELAKCVNLKPDSDEAVLAERLAAMRQRLEDKRASTEAGQKQLATMLAGRPLDQWRAKADEAKERRSGLALYIDNLKIHLGNKKELAEISEKTLAAQKEKTGADEKLALAKDHLTTTEKELARLNADLMLWQKIQGLTDHRAELVDGQPCPLCGAAHHPWADDPQLRPAAQSDALKKALTESESRRAKLAGQIAGLTADESRLKESLKNFSLSEEKLRVQTARLEAELNAQKLKLGLAEDAGEDPAKLSGLMIEAEKEVKSLDQLTAEAGALEKELTKAREELINNTALTVEAERLFADTARRVKELKALQDDRDQVLEKRKQKLPDLQADEAEKNLAEQLSAAEKGFELARTAAEKAAAENQAAGARQKDAEKNLTLFQQEQNRQDKNFNEKITAAGFAGHKAWAEALLPQGERNRLALAERELAEKKAALAADMARNKTALEAARPKVPAGLNPAELLSEIQNLDQQRQSLHKQSGVIEEKLAALSQAKAKHEKLKTELEAQKREKDRWEKLSELIGSADGQKYRNFAQGLTFETVVRKANRKLADLSDRYLLIHDRDVPLELKVIDNYQGGEIRSAKNLSGGESFIVSLALALGLSQMASRRLRVDSLFLDEGFGTLDENTLETVLETLSALKEDGKLIGLISHIPALTERIPTQIKVRRLNGPHSAISGPGVS